MEVEVKSVGCERDRGVGGGGEVANLLVVLLYITLVQCVSLFKCLLVNKDY